MTFDPIVSDLGIGRGPEQEISLSSIIHGDAIALSFLAAIDQPFNPTFQILIAVGKDHGRYCVLIPCQ